LRYDDPGHFRALAPEAIPFFHLLGGTDDRSGLASIVEPVEQRHGHPAKLEAEESIKGWPPPLRNLELAQPPAFRRPPRWRCRRRARNGPNGKGLLGPSKPSLAAPPRGSGKDGQHLPPPKGLASPRRRPSRAASLASPSPRRPGRSIRSAGALSPSNSSRQRWQPGEWSASARGPSRRPTGLSPSRR